MLTRTLITIFVLVVIAASVKYLFSSNNFKADDIKKADIFKIYVALMMTLILIGPIFFLYLGTKDTYAELFIKTISISTLVFFGSILILIIASFIYNYFKRKTINEHS